jgi:hypothetical protein
VDLPPNPAQAALLRSLFAITVWLVGNSSLIRFRKSTLSSVRIGRKR